MNIAIDHRSQAVGLFAGMLEQAEAMPELPAPRKALIVLPHSRVHSTAKHDELREALGHYWPEPLETTFPPLIAKLVLSYLEVFRHLSLLPSDSCKVPCADLDRIRRRQTKSSRN